MSHVVAEYAVAASDVENTTHVIWYHTEDFFYSPGVSWARGNVPIPEAIVFVVLAFK